MEEKKGRAGAVLLRLPRSLKDELSKLARREGVSLNQSCVYVLAAQVGRERSANPLRLGPFKEVLKKKWRKVAENHAAISKFYLARAIW